MGNREPVRIGGRTELFIDDYLIADVENAHLKLHPPRREEIVLTMDRPWEGPGSGVYSTVFRDGETYRMYYRATAPDNEGGDRGASQFCCCTESADGIHWERKSLGLVEFHGSMDNNIVVAGVEAHNFSPWLDENPACPPDERYKAVCGLSPHGLMAYKSADGYAWEKLQKAPVITQGEFDSHNVWFWDTRARLYRCYSRYWAGSWSGIRAIQSCTSADFRHWGAQIPHSYACDAPLEHFYTNATVLCPGAEHHTLSFPMRFVPDRKKWEDYPEAGVSDAVFITSRDGTHFDRTFTEPWIAPGPDPRNWTQRNFITACGILETSPEEFSLYVNEHYQWDDAYIRRYTVRRHGFGSMHADIRGGTFTTRPLVFDGGALRLNYATSAVGSVRVGILGDERSIDRCDAIYGDELDKQVTWGGSGDLSALRGRSVRLVVELRDADLFALRFV